MSKSEAVQSWVSYCSRRSFVSCAVSSRGMFVSCVRAQGSGRWRDERKIGCELFIARERASIFCDVGRWNVSRMTFSTRDMLLMLQASRLRLILRAIHVPCHGTSVASCGLNTDSSAVQACLTTALLSAWTKMEIPLSGPAMRNGRLHRCVI